MVFTILVLLPLFLLLLLSIFLFFFPAPSSLLPLPLLSSPFPPSPSSSSCKHIEWNVEVMDCGFHTLSSGSSLPFRSNWSSQSCLFFNFSHWTGAISWYKEKKMRTHFWVSAFLPISFEPLWGLSIPSPFWPGWAPFSLVN